MKKLVHFLNTRCIKRFINKFERAFFSDELGLCEEGSYFVTPNICTCPRKVFLLRNSSFLDGAVIIINGKGEEGRFIMKQNSGASQNLTVITGNHQRVMCHWFKEFVKDHEYDIDKDVVVEEDVWLGANVTLLPGVIVGRGASVGAGSVCVKSIPPYAVVIGNPAKVVGFNYTPEQIVEHEKALYPEEERIPLETLEKNYKKYFLDRITEIKSFTKL